MHRGSAAVATVVAAIALVGQAAVTPGPATADDTASPVASASPSPTAAATSSTTANQPPTAVDDLAAVRAGESVVVPVLENDTDDGLGRPDGEAARLEVVSVAGDDARVTFDATTITFRSGTEDRGDVTVGYVVSDGSLQDEGTLTVTVSTADPAPAEVTMTVPIDLVALRRYVITGTVDASSRIDRVRVQIRRGGRWSTYRTDTTVGPGGRYAAPFRTDRLGRHVLRAVADLADGSLRSNVVRRDVRGEPAVRVSGPMARQQVRWSYRSGCPVGPSGLRRITANHIDYRGRVARGSVVVRASAAPTIAKLLRRAFNAGFPIKTLKPAESFYAGGSRTPSQSDLAAMRAGNTSAFNCRPVTGNPYRISQHSYGNAIDINTIQNPYVTGSRVYPSFARSYLDRTPYRKGMIVPGGVVASTMRRLGWLWGARWSHPDYQHFSSNGG
jgi:hypothetical protein